jgi:hypothetical protein
MQLRAFVSLVSDEHEISVYPIFGHEPLEQRRRELKGPSIGASHDYMLNIATIVVQVLVRRYSKPKFVTVHGFINPLGHRED